MSIALYHLQASTAELNRVQQKLSEESAAKYELAIQAERRETELRKYDISHTES